MQKHDWFIDDAYEAVQAIGQTYMPHIETMREARGWDWWDFSLAQAAVAAEPNALTAERVLARIPYMSAATVDEVLAHAADHGALVRAGEGAYRASDAAAVVRRGTVDALIEGVRQVADRTPAGADRLAELLWRQVAGCLATDIPAPSLALGRAFDPGPDAPPLARVRRYLQDLIAFRDDAHLAAWRGYGVPGHEWEVFSHVWAENIWGDPVRTAAQAAEKLGFRGYAEADYAAALDRLVARGWLAKADDGNYQLTSAGRYVRAEAEAATDRNYWEPWRLDDAEAAELQAGLAAVREALKVEEEVVAT